MRDGALYKFLYIIIYLQGDLNNAKIQKNLYKPSGLSLSLSPMTLPRSS